MKKYILILVFLFLSFFSFSQSATLKGVVMYFFNDNFGDKPDIGSEVYLLKGNSAPFKKVQECFYTDYLKTKEECKHLFEELKNTDEELSKVFVVMPKDLRKRRKALKKAIEVNINKILAIDYMQEPCMELILESIKHNFDDGAAFEVVDGNGTFTFGNLEFGKYALYIKSKQRRGRWEYLSVDLSKSSQTISHTFRPGIAIKVIPDDDTY